jgi:hypothetical protein
LLKRYDIEKRGAKRLIGTSIPAGSRTHFALSRRDGHYVRGADKRLSEIWGKGLKVTLRLSREKLGKREYLQSEESLKVQVYD